MTCDHFWIEITGIKGAKLPKPFWCCGRCGTKSDTKQKTWDGGKASLAKKKLAERLNSDLDEQERKLLAKLVSEDKVVTVPAKYVKEAKERLNSARPEGASALEIMQEVKHQIEDDSASGSQIYKEPDYETKQKFIQDRVKLLKQVLTMAYLCIGVALFCIAAGIYMEEYELIVPGPIFMLGSGFFVMWMIKGKLRVLGEPYDTLKRFK